MSSPGLALEPAVRIIKGREIRLEKGDLTALPVDAIVFYAREDLALGSGFGTAIQTRGGAAVKDELTRIGSIEMGEAVVTSAGNMTPRHIIHVCGPKFQEPDCEAKLRRAISSALQAAAEKGLSTVAFPAMGTGFYGVPLDLCAAVMVDAISLFLRRESSIAKIVLCVVDNREFRAFLPKLEALPEERS